MPPKRRKRTAKSNAVVERPAVAAAGSLPGDGTAVASHRLPAEVVSLILTFAYPPCLFVPSAGAPSVRPFGFFDHDEAVCNCRADRKKVFPLLALDSAWFAAAASRIYSHLDPASWTSDRSLLPTLQSDAALRYLPLVRRISLRLGPNHIVNEAQLAPLLSLIPRLPNLTHFDNTTSVVVPVFDALEAPLFNAVRPCPIRCATLQFHQNYYPAAETALRTWRDLDDLSIDLHGPSWMDQNKALFDLPAALVDYAWISRLNCLRLDSGVRLLDSAALPKLAPLLTNLASLEVHGKYDMMHGRPRCLAGPVRSTDDAALRTLASSPHLQQLVLYGFPESALDGIVSRKMRKLELHAIRLKDAAVMSRFAGILHGCSDLMEFDLSECDLQPESEFWLMFPLAVTHFGMPAALGEPVGFEMLYELPNLGSLRVGGPPGTVLSVAFLRFLESSNIAVLDLNLCLKDGAFPDDLLQTLKKMPKLEKVVLARHRKTRNDWKHKVKGVEVKIVTHYR
ncbi:hypothetical protein DFJ74DRAFT_396562 [Hyaloraphidium curvatum]|nr:hypothetical protein DFJ74DRAFT_396562 [Hyaloraphidium curvatum]